jgi:acetyl-CoA carboxylase biotin carboxyl carrier protein
MSGKSPRKSDAAGVSAFQDIREILDLLEERGISEFEMERNGLRVRIKREQGHGGAPRQGVSLMRAESSPAVAGPSPNSNMTGNAASAPAASQDTAGLSENLYTIKSPIVGTFFSAPAPGAPSFVKIGDVVQRGQVLCIIEAMKLMNEIEAEVAGEVIRVFVENGQPVEYGQSLFAIMPSNSH